MFIASKYGSGYETDTYFVAMTATTIIMTTIGASLNTTLIPIFTEIEEKWGRRGKLRYLNNILNIITFITIILALLAFLLSPVIIRILAKGFEGEQFELAVKLNRIGLPIIIFWVLPMFFLATYIAVKYLVPMQLWAYPITLYSYSI